MMDTNFPVSIFRPFGPVVAKVKIPTEIVEKLNEYVDSIIVNEKKSQELDWGSKLAGNVTQEFRIENELSNEAGWSTFLAAATNAYIKHATEKEISKISLIDTWIVRQFEHEYNPMHLHSGHVSGAGFLKLPDTFGEQYQTTKGENWNGCLQLVNGSRTFLSPAQYTINPEVGDLYLFPSHLLHQVYPFRETKMERRSISFNAFIDETIFKAFS